MAAEPRLSKGDDGDTNRIRPHKKSRGGCLNCKRRKVKCDEDKTACANCVKFELPCRYFSSSGGVSSPCLSTERVTPTASAADTKPLQAGRPRRGRGRPRKDWTVVAASDTGSKPLIPTPSSPSNTACSLNISDSELLLHYVSSTAATFVLGGPNKPDDPIVRFWTHNAPRIGLSHHFVLHLSLAIAGFHLAHLRPESPDRQRYESLAGEHLSTGVAEMAEALSKFEDDSYGPLYIGATLVCYCSFAAGPTGRGDLLLCDVEDSGPARWLPLIHGLKCIRQACDPKKLWSGLMAPLAPSGEPKPLNGPTFLRDGFPRVDWVDHFERLADLIAEAGGENHGVYSKSFSALSGIYAATYGDRDGGYDGPPENQFVHSWLYRVENEYVSLLRGREPLALILLALILLAHFALLLGTMDDWYLNGWVEHVIGRTQDHMPEHLVHWVRWPAEQAGMSWIENEGRT